MPISGKKYGFTQKNVDISPDEAGVYALFDGEELIYYGRAMGTSETIRSRLQAHRAGRSGRCTQRATHYMRLPTSSPATKERQLLEEFKRTNGRLPRCNERLP